LIIVRFNKSVPEDKRDLNLLDKFHAESEGILLFAIEGLKRLINNHFNFSETQNTKEELKRYRIDSNSVLSFVEELCEITPLGEIARNELYLSYKTYCYDAGLSAVSQKNFNKDLELSYPKIKRSVDRLGKTRTWKGLKLISK
jgi:putative DNA primase/helicase